jgi:hypothetical protein
MRLLGAMTRTGISGPSRMPREVPAEDNHPDTQTGHMPQRP